jgi:3-deoxy-manno-octulosonate cytidylyltransferase (CMP-KDO synthetase)
MPRALGVIPARYESTRFRGKPLAPLGNGCLVEAVWRRVAAATRIERVIVATDDERILSVCEGFGAEARMTSPEHPSGTDRVAEVARDLGEDYGIVVNVQGDEPLVTPSSLDRLVQALEDDPAGSLATLAEPIPDAETLFDPNAVKVVVADDGRALYFSRSPIPYYRRSGARLSADFREELSNRDGGLRGYLKHQGIYAYTAAALQRLTRLPASSLELDEGLEQLRALQAGWTVRVVPSDFVSIGVDTPEDLERVAGLLAQSMEESGR